MDALPELDNPAWAALAGPQADVAEKSSDGQARRFPRDMSPFCAVDAIDASAWPSMVDLVGPGRAVVFARVGDIEPPADWQQVFFELGTQYVCVDPPAAPSFETVELGADDVDEMLELTALTKPGPFLARTHEMGHYIGVRREGRLVAMAGERLRGERFSEISAVCVHPDARREGLAAALTLILAHEIRDRGQVAMLHVRDGNDAAHAVYRGIGFEARTEIGFSAFRHVPES